MYYGADSWYICPILLIPAAIIWALLDMLCEKRKLDEKIASKYNWNKHTVMKWIHRITGVIGAVGAFILVALVSLLLRFDLFSWERF